jgi:hypothetical protein
MEESVATSRDDALEILWRPLSDPERARLRSEWSELTLACPEGVTWPGGGVWNADSEDLSDNMVEHWLAAMAPSLAELGVPLDVQVIHSGYGAPSYELQINGGVLHLYDLDEDQVPSTEDPWMDCSVEPVRVVNHLLAAAGSDHRVVLMWPGGNDCLAALATPEARRELDARCEEFELVVPE